MIELKKLVLTGGPCAGKTTAKSYLSEKLADCGVTVTFVPETATMVIGSGIDPRSLDGENKMRFEELLLRTQIRLEDETFSSVAEIRGGDKRVMICDRGCMDVAAYAGRKEFEQILRRNNWDRSFLRDKRYDAVFHLETAAIDREEFYNLDNPARHETPEQARQLDQKVRDAWLGHSHLAVIDNSTLFEEKMKRLLNKTRRVLGIPVAVEIERKFLVAEQMDLDKIPVAFQKIDIEQIYLKEENGEARLRKRSQEGCGAVYYETRKKKTPSAITRIETEKQISRDEYYERFKNTDSHYEPIHKTRVCFLWKNQYFELDIFIEPERLRSLTLLEIELTEENDHFEIPDWLGKVTEVSEDKKYSNKQLARRPQ